MRPCAHQRPAADAGQHQARFCFITPGRSFGFRRRRVFQGRWASGGGRALFSLRPFAPSVSVSPPSCDGRGVRAPRGARGLGARQTGLPRRRDTKPGGRKAFTRGRREASSGSGILSGERLSLGTLARLPLKPPSSGEEGRLPLEGRPLWAEGRLLWSEGGLYEGTKGGRQGFYRSGLFPEQKEAFRLNESLLSTKEAFLSIRYRGGRGGVKENLRGNRTRLKGRVASS